MIVGRRAALKMASIAFFVIIFLLYNPLRREQTIPVVRAILYRNRLEIWVEEIANLYAASVDLCYDSHILAIDRLETGSLFKDCGKSWMEVVKRVDQDKGMAEFAVSLTGNAQPIEGAGVLVKIYFSLFSEKLPNLRFYDHTAANIGHKDDLSVVVKLADDNIRYILYDHTLEIVDE
ncbi:MAG: hypothetical protein PWR01_219 [Clostridiales bacterium]|nr:hypothetical protein [Clostridiales bacterium]